MRLRLTSPAAAELADAFDWYNDQRPGLGAQFLDDYDNTLERVCDNPVQFPILRGGLRKARFHRFPYSLFFRILADKVEIVACFHSSRNPRHWQRRT